MNTTEVLSEFASDVKEGLLQFPKRLPSKYFYNEKGDYLFQQIMHLEEYYLTNAEFEVFEENKAEILKAFLGGDGEFRLVELGAGDGTKTKVLLNHFVSKGTKFTYSPIDISGSVLDGLTNALSQEIPALSVEPIKGDYFKALAGLKRNNSMKEVVLFLGSNIGNFMGKSGETFLRKLGEDMSKGDLLLIGFDMMKNPEEVLAAYNDAMGVTREFNLNLLDRINEELGANFDRNNFQHFPTYDPITGETKSHLVSKCTQNIHIAALDETFEFKAWEAIHTEVSQKFSHQMIEQLAKHAGFRIVQNFTDSNEYFVDSLWEKL
ncbi:L-histidine N(alpha)-methyltransferase [Roseivirga pacifica]|uniref:L-histidine N(alpha)-methyltransferase n=1 Tax=Roseivirga pacifica TaxID=1267423 RepID=UPI003BB1DD12